ncbi:MAG: hypothetical protein ABL897_08615 [Hyphomicrobium sp.]
MEAILSDYFVWAGLNTIAALIAALAAWLVLRGTEVTASAARRTSA